jgi:Ca-activated chloride channel homolog
VGNSIEIYTVTFSAEADQLKMQEVAAIGNGKHFHATTPAELSEAFKAISNTLPTLITY